MNELAVCELDAGPLGPMMIVTIVVNWPGWFEDALGEAVCVLPEED